MKSVCGSPAWMISRADRVGEGDVGAHVEAEPAVGPLRGGGAARVDDEQLGAAVHRLEDVVEEDRVGFARVRAPEDDHVGVLDLLVATGAAPGPKTVARPTTLGSVSSAVAGVDVVRADDLADQLLGEVVDLVRGLRAGEHAEGVRAVGLGHRPEPGGRPVERFVPGGGAQRAAVPDEGLGEADIGLGRRSRGHGATLPVSGTGPGPAGPDDGTAPILAPLRSWAPVVATRRSQGAGVSQVGWGMAGDRALMSRCFSGDELLVRGLFAPGIGLRRIDVDSTGRR